ncbi:hypothetical protein GVAV_000710 [Gurleya vavrai]
MKDQSFESFLNSQNINDYKTPLRDGDVVYTSNGDSRHENEAENYKSLIEKIDNLNINKEKPLQVYKFQNYTGANKGNNAEKFLSQFLLFNDEWTDAQYLGHVRANLLDKAANWYDGAEDEDFNTKKTFETAFKKIFGNKNEDTEVLLIKKLSEKIYLNDFDNYCFTLRKLSKKSLLDFNQLKSILVGKLPDYIREDIAICKNWNELNEKTEKITNKYKKNKYTEEKNSKITNNTNFDETKQFECKICHKNNHEEKNCFFKKKGNSDFIGNKNFTKNNFQKTNETSQKKDQYNEKTTEKKILKIQSSGQKSINQLKLNIKINKLKHVGIVATGADELFISKKMVENLKILYLKSTEKKVELAIGSGQILGHCFIEITNSQNNLTCHLKAYIIDELLEDIILGLNAIVKLEIDINKLLIKNYQHDHRIAEIIIEKNKTENEKLKDTENSDGEESDNAKYLPQQGIKLENGIQIGYKNMNNDIFEKTYSTN